MQQAEDQRKIMDTTIIESACKIYDINVWERIKSLNYWSLNFSCLHIVLEEKSTTYKFRSFQNMYKQMSKWGMFKYDGQTKTNQTLALLRV